MKVGVLTSSRADYSIYLPLLKKLNEDPFFDLGLIVFGMHVSPMHGNTINTIKESKFKISNVLENVIADDAPQSISGSMGRTISEFSNIWPGSGYDLVFAFGDRYEMFSAVASTVPFNLNIAHIHGGETTTGAIDDCFRHSITHMSDYHFTVAEEYKNRVIQLKGNDKNVYNVGSLSYDNLKNQELMSLEEFKKKFDIDLSKPTILITFHPETVAFEKNELFISEIISALNETEGYQFVITMPNADTMGNMIRQKLNEFISVNKNAIGMESFGTVGYLSCMKHCSFMLGNTSSGFAEAAFFPKYVVNLGSRQDGRIVTDNIYNCRIEKKEILKAITHYKSVKLPSSISTYGNGTAADSIIKILKEIHGKF
jgi:GDP/UDP-N,N'-diacetylbacillosamine 2-epimerase (hydrolysing)